MSAPEAAATFDCFGAECTVIVGGAGPDGSAQDAVRDAREQLLAWHRQFSRFLPGSELSRLNADSRPVVPASALMVRLAQAVARAGALTGGLVDGTLAGEIARAGYGADLGEPLDLVHALRLAPARAPAGPSSRSDWTTVRGQEREGVIVRPPGVQLDSGGLVKGLLADALGARLAAHEHYAVICAGDLVVGGPGGVARAIDVQSPFDESVLHTFESARCGVATSGIGRRSWLGADGVPAHHLLDPATGRPAFTGIVQATALAPTGLEAEILAKAALLSGPRGARRWLAHGGAIVLDDGSHVAIEPPLSVERSELAAFA